MKKSLALATFLFLVALFSLPVFAVNWISCSDDWCNKCDNGISVPELGKTLSCGLLATCNDDEFCCDISWWPNACYSIKDTYEVKCNQYGEGICTMVESPSLDCEDYGSPYSYTPSIRPVCYCTKTYACLKDSNGNEFSLEYLAPFSGSYAPGCYKDCTGDYANYNPDTRCKSDTATWCDPKKYEELVRLPVTL